MYYSLVPQYTGIPGGDFAEGIMLIFSVLV